MAGFDRQKVMGLTSHMTSMRRNWRKKNSLSGYSDAVVGQQGSDYPFSEENESLPPTSENNGERSADRDRGSGIGRTDVPVDDDELLRHGGCRDQSVAQRTGGAGQVCTPEREKPNLMRV